MVHDEIIQLHILLLLFLPFTLNIWHVMLELDFPFMIKFLTSDPSSPKYAHISIKHMRVSSFFESFLKFAHLPFECLLIKFRNVLSKQLSKDLANSLQFFLILLEVELERTKSNSTVIQCCYCQTALPHHLWSLDILQCILPHRNKSYLYLMGRVNICK